MTNDFSYKKSGIDVAAAKRSIDLARGAIDSTRRAEVLGDIGGFAGLFELAAGKYERPVLVSATDGVGTKLDIARLMDKHDTVGIDLVAMVVDDLAVTGAEPLFFLDYLAIGKVKPDKVAAIIEGIAAGCRQAGCALIGGETAEHPGVMGEDQYDLAGFGVGVVEADRVIDGRHVAEGDVILGLASSGLHSNGFSLVRSIFGTDSRDRLEQQVSALKQSLAEELLTPTRIYAPALLKLYRAGAVKAAAHITGGGLIENLPRVLPATVNVIINTAAWSRPPIFELIQERGRVAEPEMWRIFNMGIGMAVVVSADAAGAARHVLEDAGEAVFEIGKVTAGEGRVVLE